MELIILIKYIELEMITLRYEGIVYRPPSEAYSLIVQVTIGCSHNGCTFCNMYKEKKFRIRDLEDIMEDLQQAKLKLWSS